MTNISGRTEKAGKLRMMLVVVIDYKAVNRFQTGNRHEIKRNRREKGGEEQKQNKTPKHNNNKSTNKQTRTKKELERNGCTEFRQERCPLSDLFVRRVIQRKQSIPPPFYSKNLAECGTVM